MPRTAETASKQPTVLIPITAESRYHRYGGHHWRKYMRKLSRSGGLDGYGGFGGFGGYGGYGGWGLWKHQDVDEES
jgi:hypothetical protein